MAVGKRPRRKRRPRKRQRRWLSGAGLIVVGLIVAGLVFIWARATVIPRMVQMELIGEQLFEVSIEHRMLVIRDEQVMVAPGTGSLVVGVGDGKFVRSGTIIGRVTNEAAERRIKSDLEQVTAELGQARAIAERYEADSDVLLTSLWHDLDDVAYELARACQLGRWAEVDEYRTLMMDIGSDIEAVIARRRDEWAVVDELERRRMGLIAAQEETSAPIIAPRPGVVSWSIDELEQIITDEWLDSVTVSDFFQVESELKRISGDVITGDQVGRVVNTFQTTLVTDCPVDETYSLIRGSRVQLVIGDTEVSSNYLGRVSDEERGLVLIAFTVDRDVPELIDHRFVDVSVVTERTYGTVVQASSLVSSEGETGVYVAHRAFVQFVPVRVIAQTKEQVLVDGLEVGSRVIINPWLVWDGMVLP